MKQVVILLVCLATVSLAQRPNFNEEDFRKERASSVQEERPPRPIAILRQNSVFNVDGQFKHDFAAENGISEETSGYIKPVEDGKVAQTMKGHYAYTAPDGTPIEASWWADETGFHIEARHIPTPPPTPAVIARSLELLPTLMTDETVSSSSAGQRSSNTAFGEERAIPKRFKRWLV